MLSLITTTSILYACGKGLNLCYYFTSNKTNEYEDINNLLLKTDIKCKIAKTHLFLKDVDDKTLSNCVKLAIKDLEEVIIKINLALQHFIVVNENYNALYFKKWRSNNLNLLTNLENDINLFNIRFEDMVQFYNLK